MQTITSRCELEVQRGPDWLLVRIKGFDPDDPDAPLLAERIRRLLQQHFTYRLVLELDQAPLLNSPLIGQLLELHQWIEEHDGVMRLCGLSPYNRQVLHVCHLDEQLLPYRDCREAVLGSPRCRRPR
jgi:anti-anti-sigma regulatory factor